MLVGQVLLGIEPEVLGTGQGVDPLGPQFAVLALAHGVDGLAHVFHDVESVEDDLVLCIVQVFLDRVDVGLPHIHGHRRDGVALGAAKGIEVAVETGLFAVVGDVLDGAADDVIDQGEVGVTLAGRFLVHPDQGRDSVLFGRLSPGDGPLHDPPTLVPGHLQDVGGAGDVGLFQHVDGEALEGRGEAAAGLGPRQADLADPVGRALHPWGSGVEPGGEASGVEVAPGSLLGVVEDGEFGLALGTGPQPAFVVRDGDVDPFVLDREVDVLDVPGVSEPEDLGVELDVAHGCPPEPGSGVYPPKRHLQCRFLLSPLPRPSPVSRDGRSPSENRSASGGSQRTLDAGARLWPPARRLHRSESRLGAMDGSAHRPHISERKFDEITHGEPGRTKKGKHWWRWHSPEGRCDYDPVSSYDSRLLLTESLQRGEPSDGHRRRFHGETRQATIRMLRSRMAGVPGRNLEALKSVVPQRNIAAGESPVTNAYVHGRKRAAGVDPHVVDQRT